MVDSDIIAASGQPGRRLVIRLAMLLIAVPLALALVLLAGVARPTSLAAARSAVGEGIDEAQQLWLGLTFWPSAPYPASEVLAGFELDWSTHQRAAAGSGDWGITWADDDHQYTAWGNGGGFGGSDRDGRVMLGFARVEGPAGDYHPVNVWGGLDAENPAQFGGKAYSLLSVGGVLYTWRCGDADGDSALDFQELYSSTDYSATWRSTGVRFTQNAFGDGDPGFYCPVFLQYGRDYEGARDDYVYIYAPEIQQTESLYPQMPGEMALMRVPKSLMTVISTYEFFAGIGQDGEPIWTFDGAGRTPVFSDAANGITQHIAAVYNPGLDRYILATEHSDHAEGNIAIYDAPTPWGPWTTVHFSDSFGRFRTLDNGFMWVFPSKWLSEDGREFTMIYTGKGRNDSWNTVDGRFLMADGSD